MSLYDRLRVSRSQLLPCPESEKTADMFMSALSLTLTAVPLYITLGCAY